MCNMWHANFPKHLLKSLKIDKVAKNQLVSDTQKGIDLEKCAPLGQGVVYCGEVGIEGVLFGDQGCVKVTIRRHSLR